MSLAKRTQRLERIVTKRTPDVMVSFKFDKILFRAHCLLARAYGSQEILEKAQEHVDYAKDMLFRCKEVAKKYGAGIPMERMNGDQLIESVMGRGTEEKITGNDIFMYQKMWQLISSYGKEISED